MKITFIFYSVTDLSRNNNSVAPQKFAILLILKSYILLAGYFIISYSSAILITL